jgi:hypothetical protein
MPTAYQGGEIKIIGRGGYLGLENSATHRTVKRTLKVGEGLGAAGTIGRVITINSSLRLNRNTPLDH